MDLYREEVLDHYKHPRNFGKMEEPDIDHKDANPLCGDEIEMQIKVSDGKVAEVMFEGQGCAISQASASMLTERIKGMKLEEIMKLGKEDVMGWLHTQLTPSRVGCALLPLMVAKAGVEEYKIKIE